MDELSARRAKAQDETTETRFAVGAELMDALLTVGTAAAVCRELGWDVSARLLRFADADLSRAILELTGIDVSERPTVGIAQRRFDEACRRRRDNG
jgi:hypothetical protein